MNKGGSPKGHRKTMSNNVKIFFQGTAMQSTFRTILMPWMFASYGISSEQAFYDPLITYVRLLLIRLYALACKASRKFSLYKSSQSRKSEKTKTISLLRMRHSGYLAPRSSDLCLKWQVLGFMHWSPSHIETAARNGEHNLRCYQLRSRARYWSGRGSFGEADTK